MAKRSKIPPTVSELAQQGLTWEILMKDISDKLLELRPLKNQQAYKWAVMQRKIDLAKLANAINDGLEPSSSYSMIKEQGDVFEGSGNLLFKQDGWEIMIHVRLRPDKTETKTNVRLEYSGKYNSKLVMVTRGILGTERIKDVLMFEKVMYGYMKKWAKRNSEKYGVTGHDLALAEEYAVIYDVYRRLMRFHNKLNLSISMSKTRAIALALGRDDFMKKIKNADHGHRKTIVATGYESSGCISCYKYTVQGEEMIEVVPSGGAMYRKVFPYNEETPARIWKWIAAWSPRGVSKWALSNEGMTADELYKLVGGDNLAETIN